MSVSDGVPTPACLLFTPVSSEYLHETCKSLCMWLFIRLTVYTGVVFGFELFLQTCLKCKFHLNFGNVSTLNCFYTPDHALFPAAVLIRKVLSQISALGLMFFFFYFLISHKHLRVPRSFSIIFGNLAPLASPKASSRLGDLRVVKSSLHTDSTLKPCGLKNILSPSSL